MAALTDDQIELLRRTRDGLAPWGGVVRLDRLQAQIELLLALRLIEPDGTNPYRLTALGALVLDAAR
jgi:hypothetical protein